MPFEFPIDCDAVKVPSFLSDAAKGVFDAVSGGGAFQNPFDGDLSFLTDALTGGGGGLIDKLNGMIENSIGTDLELQLRALSEHFGIAHTYLSNIVRRKRRISPRSTRKCQ